MTTEEHIEKHKILQKHLHELTTDFINHTGRLPSQATILELMKWSNQQTIKPINDIQKGGDKQ